MNEQDRIRLKHMLDAVEEALGFAEGQERADLDANRMLMRALVKDIEIVGEAAAKLSKEFQEAHPELPWSDIIGMRNRLIHAYFDVDLDRVWDTVQHDLPFIQEALLKMLEQ